MDLSEIRKEIDNVDRTIVEAFIKRMDLCQLVAEYKKENGINVLDSSRENEKLEAISELAGEKYAGYAVELYKKMMELSRELQKSQIGVYGLLGGKLGHSYSPLIHKMFGGYDYNLYEREENEVEAFLKERAFDGINVTIPYKKAVIPYLDELSENAKKIGSVNTIVKLPDGRLRGDNTDYYGFEFLVNSNGIEVSGKKCVVLGDGGVAPTIRAVLEDMGAKEIVTVSRRGEDNFDNISKHADAQIIVNMTPVGMYPKNGVSLVDLSMFDNLSGVLDVVYNPNKTKMILDAEEKEIPCAGGLAMLVAQAKRACELFLNSEIEDSRIMDVTYVVEGMMKNVALIGMPGCGKTTTGTQLAKLTGREFVDMDDEIVKHIGCSIPEFFAANGEEAFRKVETEVLEEFSKKSGLIISTGGGVVTRPENKALLHQNSIVVFLNRKDLQSLAKDGRPVSQSKSVEQLVKERMPMYTTWCDIAIDCVNEVENARKIAEVLKL